MQPTRAWPSSIWPAQPAQPTSSPLSSSSSARRTNRGEAWRAPERPRPPPASPGHLLLPPRRPGDATHLPASLPHSPASSSSPLDLSLTRRTEPPPPTSSLAATATPSPPRRAPELRCSALVLLVVSRDQKSPGMPPPMFSPSPAAEDLHRRFATIVASPSSLTLPARSP